MSSSRSSIPISRKPELVLVIHNIGRHPEHGQGQYSRRPVLLYAARSWQRTAQPDDQHATGEIQLSGLVNATIKAVTTVDGFTAISGAGSMDYRQTAQDGVQFSFENFIEQPIKNFLQLRATQIFLLRSGQPHGYSRQSARHARRRSSVHSERHDGARPPKCLEGQRRGKRHGDGVTHQKRGLPENSSLSGGYQSERYSAWPGQPGHSASSPRFWLEQTLTARPTRPRRMAGRRNS